MIFLGLFLGDFLGFSQGCTAPQLSVTVTPHNTVRKFRSVKDLCIRFNYSYRDCEPRTGISHARRVSCIRFSHRLLHSTQLRGLESACLASGTRVERLPNLENDDEEDKGIKAYEKGKEWKERDEERTPRRRIR
ncbi:hypothetical protein K438DRAFT_912732 [Mycena galopus ATCC 62051]|nr:hypothetical protein K438DRAFT_912732 [Mycena galopus ATCC 62051]